MASRKNHGLSPLVSSVLVIAIVLISSLMVLSQLVPSIKKFGAFGALDSGKQAISSFDMAVQEILYEAPGAKRVVSFRTSDGKFRISGKEDMIQFSIGLDASEIDPGAITKDGKMIINYGPGISAYETDIDNDGENDLILENDAVLFAIRKHGSASSWATLNLTNHTHTFITAMKNKRLGINMTPVIGIYINGVEESSYGNGYTELVEAGSSLEGGVIRLYMNSSSGFVYEAFFRLLPGTDFIQSEVKLR